MRSQVNPVFAIIVIAVVVLLAGFFIWQKSRGPSTGPGRLKSNLDASKMEKDPEKFRQGVQDLLRKEQQEKAGR